MIKALCLDIETISNPAMLDLLPPVEPNKTLKDLAKIQADIEAKKQAQIDKMGLDPTTNLICSLAVEDVDTKDENVWMLNEGLSNEAELLAEFWEIAHGYDRFVTFNGMAFDIPIIKFHSMLHGVRPAVDIKCSKYRIENHIDIRMILANGDQYAKGNQDYYCKLILGPDQGKPAGIDGSMVQSFWDAGLYDEIREYNLDDTRKLTQLYQRLLGYYF